MPESMVPTDEICERSAGGGGGGMGGRMDIRGVYRFSSLMKQKKKAKIYAVFCFAGKRKLFCLYL
jgi:hypothetical protein